MVLLWHLVVAGALSVGMILGQRVLWITMFLGSALCGASAFLAVFVPGDPVGKALFDLGLAVLLWLCGLMVKNE
jgi:Na+-transporting NADH:ubiquinone oxidoreductase subunit NqrB